MSKMSYLPMLEKWENCIQARIHPDMSQNLIYSCLWYAPPTHKVSRKAVDNFLVILFTDRQTNKPTKLKTNITSFFGAVIACTEITNC